MGKTAKNPMSEEELLSALGLSVSAAEPKEKPAPQIDGDLLIDILAPESNAAKRSSADAARERAREEQEREKRLRSQEWKRELEERQMREAAMAAAAEQEREEREQAAARTKAQPIIPNSEEMRDIEDVAVMAEEKRRAADEVERRRLAMQAQVRKRQEEVAAEAQAAAEAAKRRAQEQEAVKQAAAENLAAQRRSQARQDRNSQPLQGEQGHRSQPLQGETASNSQPIQREPDPKRQVRVSQQPRATGYARQQPGPRSAQVANRPPRDSRSSADAMRARPQGYSQELGHSAPIQSAPRPEMAPEHQPMPSAYQQQAPQQASQQVDRKQRKKKEKGPKRDVPRSPQSKESPLGVVLIVLAVLCVLVAASLLTGLWDISNL